MKIDEVLQNEAFKEKILGAKDAAEACQILAEYGIEMTEEKIEKDLKQVEEGSEELEEDDLESVAGGLLYIRPIGNKVWYWLNSLFRR